MKLKIKSIKIKPFKDDAGQEVQYCWYRAIRLDTGYGLQFGSKNLNHAVGSEVDLDISEDINSFGKKVYKEYVES